MTRARIIFVSLAVLALTGVGLFTMNIVNSAGSEAAADAAVPDSKKASPQASAGKASQQGASAETQRAQGTGSAAPASGESARGATGHTAAATNAPVFTTRSAAREVTLTAFTRARNFMELVSEESGRCVSVAADVGETIGQDGVFARLDTTYIRLDLEANRAEQARSRSDLNYYSKERRRYDTLVKGQQAAQSTLDDLVRNEEVAKRTLQSLRIEERRLVERMSRYTIKAPTGWKVLERDVEPGEWVRTGQTVGRLGNYSVLLVPFAFTPEELALLRKRSAEGVRLTLPDYGGKTVTARVERVNPGFDPETRKIAVDLAIHEGDFEFRGGIRCRLTVDLPDPGGSVLVPASALLKAYEEYFLVRPSGERVRVVLLGSGPEGTRRVTAPELKPGQTYLLNPVQ